MGEFYKKHKWDINFLIVLALMLTLKWTGIFRIAYVLGESMEPNYYQGDIVISSTLLDYDYGDVVNAYADYGDGKKSVIKRVIAIPGDTIEQKENKIYLNGEVLQEDYETIYDDNRNRWKWICDEDEYFLMGDNRPNSGDSRHIGPIKEMMGEIFVHIPTGKIFHYLVEAIK